MAAKRLDSLGPDFEEFFDVNAVNDPDEEDDTAIPID